MKRLLILPEAQIAVYRFFIGITFIVIATAGASEGIIGISTVTAIAAIAAVTTASRTGAGIFFGIFDLLIGGIDFLHLAGSLFITGIQIRVIFFRQPAVCLLYIFVGGIPVQTKHLVRIIYHFLFPSPFDLWCHG